jgi:hypothetical protein
VRLSLSALGAAALLYGLVTAGLQALTRMAEASGEVYPYRDQDWLRFLSGPLWPQSGKPLLLLTGPSTAREDLLVETFGAAYPRYRVRTGALSLGTLSDVMASLTYVERAHGAGALPAILVLGVSPRFLAEIPRERPFAVGLERYSACCRVPGNMPDGFRLEEKSWTAGLVARVRFLTRKQQDRYRTAVAWLAASSVGPAASTRLAGSAPVRFLRRTRLARLMGIEELARLGIYDYAMLEMSPYRYRGVPPLPREDLERWLDDPGSWWREVYRWDPDRGAALIAARTEALLGFAARHDMELYVVSLPERELSRRRYGPGHAARYDALVRRLFGSVPVLDLRCLLGDDEFYDAEHALVGGARRVSEHVIQFMADTRAGRGAGGAEPRETGAACPVGP